MGQLRVGGCRCILCPSRANLNKDFISQGAPRLALQSVEIRMRLRIQTWQRHHGLLDPLQEKDERGDNVRAGAAGECAWPSVLCRVERHELCVGGMARGVSFGGGGE